MLVDALTELSCHFMIGRHTHLASSSLYSPVLAAVDMICKRVLASLFSCQGAFLTFHDRTARASLDAFGDNNGIHAAVGICAKF